MAAKFENAGAPVPIDMVTTSASGFDPHITPANAEFQVPRVAKARGISVEQLRTMVAKHTEGRDFGILGEGYLRLSYANSAENILRALERMDGFLKTRKAA